MKILSMIFGAFVTVLGILSAIKTLAPAEITYVDLFNNALFLSGWVVSVILAIMMIFQEDRHRQQKIKDSGLLVERGNDKDYLKAEMAKSNISLNHLTSRLTITERPIPKSQREGNDNDF